MLALKDIVGIEHEVIIVVDILGKYMLSYEGKLMCTVC